MLKAFETQWLPKISTDFSWERKNGWNSILRGNKKVFLLNVTWIKYCITFTLKIIVSWSYSSTDHYSWTSSSRKENNGKFIIYLNSTGLLCLKGYNNPLLVHGKASFEKMVINPETYTLFITSILYNQTVDLWWNKEVSICRN